MSEPSPEVADESSPVLLTLGLETGLAVLAILLSWSGLYDHSQSLTELDWHKTLLPALVYGSVGALPLVLLSWWSGISRLRFFRSIRQSLRESLLPMLKGCSLSGLIIIAAAAGLGEELLFRWSIQGGVTSQSTVSWGLIPGLAIGGLLFGLCHAVSRPYFIIATVIGIYLGLMMWLSGTWLSSALAHFLVDLFSLSWMVGYLPIRYPDMDSDESEFGDG